MPAASRDTGNSPDECNSPDDRNGPDERNALDRRYDAFARHVGKAPGGRLALRLTVFVAGLLFVLGGLLLVVLPGPLTIPPVLVGVYAWSLEFGWARRLRERATDNAEQAWESARRHPVRAATVTCAGLAAAGATLWVVAHYDLVSRGRDLVSSMTATSP